jgi:hypothetical protein
MSALQDGKMLTES